MSTELARLRKHVRSSLETYRQTHTRLLQSLGEKLTVWNLPIVERQISQLLLRAALETRERTIEAIRAGLDRAARRAQEEAGRTDVIEAYHETYHNMLLQPFRYRTLDQRIRLLYNRFYLSWMKELRASATKETDMEDVVDYFRDEWLHGLWHWIDRLVTSEFHRADFALMVQLGLQWRMKLEWEVGERCGKDGQCVRFVGRHNPSEVPRYPHPLCDCVLHFVK